METMEAAVGRLKHQYLVDEARESEAGLEAGKEWAMLKAQPLQLMALERLRGQGIRDTDQLYRAVIARSVKEDEAAPTFGEAFGCHLIGDSHTPLFLRGFVQGALSVWEEVKRQLAEERK